LWKYLALDAAAFWPGKRSKRIVSIWGERVVLLAMD
jgi:hypothetical protein